MLVPTSAPVRDEFRTREMNHSVYPHQEPHAHVPWLQHQATSPIVKSLKSRQKTWDSRWLVDPFDIIALCIFYRHFKNTCKRMNKWFRALKKRRSPLEGSFWLCWGNPLVKLYYLYFTDFDTSPRRSRVPSTWVRYVDRLSWYILTTYHRWLSAGKLNSKSSFCRMEMLYGTPFLPRMPRMYSPVSASKLLLRRPRHTLGTRGVYGSR